jgi:hypothetical protein
MWKMVDRTSLEGNEQDSEEYDYYKLDVEKRIHILNSKLKDNYEIYVRETDGTQEIMVYDTVLCDFYTEEQDDYRNLIVFWESIFNPTLS